jgi:hypothetical protein
MIKALYRQRIRGMRVVFLFNDQRRMPSLTCNTCFEKKKRQERKKEEELLFSLLTLFE